MQQGRLSAKKFGATFVMVALLSVPSVGCLAASPPTLETPEYAGGETVMNGYSLKQFGDFVKNWHFVTVRYRRDSGEIRFVYANDLAWTALKADSKDYPDGAVFAKVNVASGEDPAFTDSAVPVNPTHVQIMVRDHAKHKATHGWGYAIFGFSTGLTAPGKSPEHVARACDACHQIIPQRGYAFAQIMPDISPATAKPKVQVLMDKQTMPVIPFETVALKDIPKNVQTALPQGTKTVRRMKGEMPLYMFQGSMHESLPFVGSQAAQSGMPAVLISETDSKMFSALWVQQPKQACRIPGGGEGYMVAGTYYAVITETPPPGADPKAPVASHMDYVRVPTFCAVVSRELLSPDDQGIR